MCMNERARNYYNMGYSVIPLKAESKHPAIYWEAYQERRATEEEFAGFEFGNIGIVTGKVSGIVVLDIDGMDWVGSLQAAGLSDYLRGQLVSVVSGSGGLHIYLPWSEELEGIGNVYLYQGKDANVQLKTHGGYIVAPGSIHPETGDVYELQTLSELPSPQDLPAPPPELYAAIQKRLRASRSEWSQAPEAINEGSRNRTLFSHARKLFQHGYSELEVASTLFAMNESRCKPQMEDDEVERIVESAATYERGTLKVEEPSSTERGTSALDLLTRDFKPLDYAVSGIIPEGLSLLVGSAKVGKSWIALQLCISVATGKPALGKLEVQQGKALYLALEDNERRLQRRLKDLIGESRDAGLANLIYKTNWPSIPDGGAGELDTWLSDNPDTKLVVIDTLKMIRGKAKGGNVNAYDVDYESVKPLLQIAGKYGVALVLVHHTRQMKDNDDWFNEVSGSTGLTAGVDNLIYLRRERGADDATLLYDGRDVEIPGELALQWSLFDVGWTVTSDAPNFHKLTPERKELWNAVKQLGTATPKEVAGAVGKSEDNIKKTLGRMLKEDQLVSVGYGKYSVESSHSSPSGYSSHSSHSGHSSHSTDSESDTTDGRVTPTLETSHSSNTDTYAENSTRVTRVTGRDRADIPYDEFDGDEHSIN